jgi:hypothetical protein
VHQHRLEHGDRQAAELGGDLAHEDRRVLDEITPLGGQAVIVVDLPALAMGCQGGGDARLALGGVEQDEILFELRLEIGSEETLMGCPARPRGRKRWPNVTSPLWTTASAFAPFFIS